MTIARWVIRRLALFALLAPVTGCLFGAEPPPRPIGDLGAQPMDFAQPEAEPDLARPPPDLEVPPCVMPPAGIVSWWPGDGHSRDIVGPRDAMPKGDEAYAMAMVGQGFRIDSMTTPYFSASDEGLPFGDVPITLEMWVSVQASDHGNAFFAGYGDPAVQQGVFWVGTKGGYLWWADNHASVVADGSIGFAGLIPVGGFHHVVVMAGFLAVSLWVDGAWATSMPVGGVTTSRGSFYIGGLPDGDPQYPWTGIVDEVTLYDRKLEPEEIQAIYHAGSSGKCK